LTTKRLTHRHKMRLFLTSLALTALLASADDRWDRLGKIWDELKTSENVASPGDRKIIEMFTLSALQTYGCWCRFNTVTPHRGPIMNELDGFCRSFYLNYDCLVNDFGERCDVSYTEQYNTTLTSVLSPFNQNTDYLAECTAANPNDACLAAACAVDSDFIRSVMNFLSTDTIDMRYNAFFGFDGTDGSCVTRLQAAQPTAFAPPILTTQASNPGAPAEGTRPPKSDCCGDYPTRYPFKTHNGDVACCDSAKTTYNLNMMVCCDASLVPQVALIGACPL